MSRSFVANVSLMRPVFFTATRMVAVNDLMMLVGPTTPVTARFRTGRTSMDAVTLLAPEVALSE